MGPAVSRNAQIRGFGISGNEGRRRICAPVEGGFKESYGSESTTRVERVVVQGARRGFLGDNRVPALTPRGLVAVVCCARDLRVHERDLVAGKNTRGVDALV